MDLQDITKDALIEKALAFHQAHYTCSQSVLCSFDSILNIDHTILFKLSEAFGGGMGTKEGYCGGLTGALMAISAANSNGDAEKLSKAETYVLDGILIDRFNKEAGSVICKDIKGTTPLEGNALISCDECIKLGVSKAYDMIKDEIE